MKRDRCIVTALLIGAAMLASTGASAQPREPAPAWVDPAGPPTEMDVWLRRMVGRYTFDGLVHVIAQGDCAPLPPQGSAPPPPFTPACQGVKGKGDCIGIGTGPGVQCVLNVMWQDMYDVNFEGGTVSALPGAISYLDPAMALFGLDPGRASINYLLVDNKGLPEGGPGSSTGNRATFRTTCVNQAVGCHRTIRIEAKQDSKLVYMWIDVEIEDGGARERVSTIMLSMRRVSQPQAIETGGTQRR
jgi:hypothetical protein